MAGGAVKYRHLSRDSAHRQALLRNLVTSLFEHETISTTWPKAKEAQRLAEKLITLAKKNTSASRRRAHQIFFVSPHLFLHRSIPYQNLQSNHHADKRSAQKPLEIVPKLFSTIRERYLSRPGGCTRVLRIEPLKEDQAPSAILELVDGPKDMRFALTAQTLARDRALNRKSSDITKMNVAKVTRYRQDGRGGLEAMVKHFSEMDKEGMQGTRDARVKEKVYTRQSGPQRDTRGPQFYQKPGGKGRKRAVEED